MDTKALRQKILDLAIRGKLVSQDPNDEPASVLLERIRAQKQQMVREGKLKAKDIKNDTVIFVGEDNLHYEKFQDGSVKCIEDEIPFEIRQGWCWARLRDICSMVAGKSKSSSDIKSVPFENCYPCFGGNGLRGFVEAYNYNGTYNIIGRQGALCGNINIASGKFYATEHAVVVTLFSGIDFRWSNFFLEGLNLNQYSTAVAQPGLSVANILKAFIPIPPQNEQVRIGAIIHQSLTIIDYITNEQTNLLKGIGVLKSRILDLAIRGKLVPQDPNDEPASVLLERIRAEKEELIKQGKIKRDKKESVIFKGEDNSYYIKTGKQLESIDDWGIDMLPDNWEICCLGELCDYGNCINVETADIDDSAWILDLEDIEKDTGRIVQKVTKRQRNSVSTKHRFHSGQVLYSKLRPYLNKVVLTEEDGYCTSEILPLDFAAPILPSYARYYLMSPTFLAYADRCSYGVKMPRLSTEDGKKSVITVPPLLEQQRIVTAIENCFDCLKDIVQAIS